MFSLTELATYCLSVFILIVIPGPTMFYLIARTLVQGKRAGVISLVGVNLADFVYIVLVAFGVSAVVISTPFLFTIIKISGSVYLLFLAYQTLTSNNNKISGVQKLAKESNLKLFNIGFLTNILNPKVMLFFASIFSQFINPANGIVWKQSAILGTFFIIISFVVNSFFIFMASRFILNK